MRITTAPPDLKRLLDDVIAAAEAAGEKLAAEFCRREGPRGAAGHADIDDEIEADLRRILLALRPGRFRGEETGFFHGTGGPWCWLVDPHDGTSSYLAGARGTAVSIALLHDGTPVLGVVHAPLSPDRGRDTIAWAEGLSAPLRNGVLLSEKPVDRALISGDIVFVSQKAAARPVGFAKSVVPARFVALPSIAYRLARVAAGDGAGVVSLNGPCGWDYAAGHALLRGAGCVLLDETGNEVTYTVDGISLVRFCFGGAPAAARDLLARDWQAAGHGAAIAPLVTLGWPRRAADAAFDRASACLLGQVIGDSLGSLVEFQGPDRIARDYPGGVRDLIDGGTWNTIAGQPTDDSELALDLARTLAGQPEFSPEAVADAYAGWFASGPFDIGTTTDQALSAADAAPFDKAGAARNAANAQSQANGALMRCAPIGIWARDAAQAASAARADAALTHPHPLCQAASAAFVAAIAAAIAGGDPAAMLTEAAAAIPEPDAALVRECLRRAAVGEGPANFVKQEGWVLIAFQNAFRHLAAGTPIEAALIATVAQGGDTDTNAAICGALLGAAQGCRAIPVRWTMKVLAARALRETGARQPRPDRYWPTDIFPLAEALLESARLGR